VGRALRRIGEVIYEFDAESVRCNLADLRMDAVGDPDGIRAASDDDSNGMAAASLE
jgi:hypothetical protein